MVSQAILIKLFGMIKWYLIRGYHWWKMPFVLVMLYQFQKRDILMKNNLFDTYPRLVEPKKQHCNDPVVGYRHLGCYSYYHGTFIQHQSSYDNCIRYCKDFVKTPYAAYNKGYKSCHCLKKFPYNKISSGYCKCKYYCSRRPYDIYRTMHCTERMKKARTVDGTCNDLTNPSMGSRLYRFGRNVPLNLTKEDNQMLEPNPRKIALEVLTRKEFIPVKQINLLTAGFIQFMVHDWFDHGEQDKNNEIHVPLERDDPAYTHHKPYMSIFRTKPNNCQQDKEQPATYQNDVTHWWDLSPIYGSYHEINRKVRAFNGGKLKMDHDLLPVDETTGIDVTGFSNNWWVGLALLHNIFTREHNAICEMLKQKYPHWTDQELYDKARLINTAVVIKIHTIEWTPAILNNTALRSGLRVNWGLDPGKETWDWLRKHNITSNPGIKPLVGGEKKLRGVPFSLTEEFVSVYRMHPLLPDHLKMRSMETKEYTGDSYTLPQYSFANARKIFKEHDMADILYTFGVEHPGALTLNNYPKFLTNLALPAHQQGGKIVDIATIDIVRDRERGIPRYNNFRRLMNLSPVESFEKLTPNAEHVAALKKLYCNDIEKLDLMIGALAEEPRPDGFGFGETAFNLFLFMASRRLEADRFLTKDFTNATYTPEGMEWIKKRDMKTVLLDSFSDIEELQNVLKDVDNAFFPWQ